MTTCDQTVLSSSTLRFFRTPCLLLIVAMLECITHLPANAQVLPDSDALRMLKHWAVPISPEALSSGVIQCQGSRWLFSGAWQKSPVMLTWDATSLEIIHPNGTVAKCDVRIELAHAAEANGHWSIVRSIAQTDHKNGVTTASVAAGSDRGFPSEFTVTISLINDQGEYLESGTYSANLSASSVNL